MVSVEAQDWMNMETAFPHGDNKRWLCCSWGLSEWRTSLWKAIDAYRALCQHGKPRYPNHTVLAPSRLGLCCISMEKLVSTSSHFWKSPEGNSHCLVPLPSWLMAVSQEMFLVSHVVTERKMKAGGGHARDSKFAVLILIAGHAF